MSDHERIWLEPAPGADEEYGRQWVQHNVFGDEATEYVRADLFRALDRERDEAAKRADNLDAHNLRNFNLAQENIKEVERLKAYLEKSRQEVAETITAMRKADKTVEQRRRAEVAEARATAAESRVRDLEERLAKAAEALEPVAELATNYNSFGPSDVVWAKGCVYVSDLRRARKALATIQETEG